MTSLCDATIAELLSRTEHKTACSRCHGYCPFIKNGPQCDNYAVVVGQGIPVQPATSSVSLRHLGVWTDMVVHATSYSLRTGAKRSQREADYSSPSSV
jgi:hypothetical protein